MHSTPFEAISKAIAQDSVLAFTDPIATLVVDNDASDLGLSAVMSQISPIGVKRQIAFASRALADNEKNWTVIVRECLAVV